MSSENKRFTAGDIERYHSGQMSVQERHALEKAALDDPFLADALEGYAYTHSPQADLAKIKSRLEEKLHRRKVVPFSKQYRWLSAAAILLIVAGAGWFAHNNSSTEQNSIVRRPQQSTQETAPAPDKIVEKNLADTNNASVSNDMVLTAPKNKTSKEAPVAVPHLVISNAVAENTDAQDTSRKDNSLSRSRTNQVQNNISRNEGDINRGVVNNMSRNISPDPNVNYRNNQVSPQMNQVFRNNDSFRNDAAFLKERNQRQSATDTINNFTVVMEPEKVNSDEVIVLNKNPEKKKLDRYPKVTIDTLEPAEGYVKFDDYIAQNLKMPEELRDKPISGEVQLSFDVDKNGKPVNITVLKSLCEKCDEEAIRLLKEGPKWKRNRNKKGKITIKF
jgi:TonB family protein